MVKHSCIWRRVLVIGLTVVALVAIGADVSAVDADGRMPLYEVSSNGHIEAIKILSEVKSDG